MSAQSVGLQHELPCTGEAGEVAVVDATVVQLAGELAEQLRQVPPGGVKREPHLDPPLDDLDGGSAGGRGSCLFPGAVPAGGRAPRGDRSSASRA